MSAQRLARGSPRRVPRVRGPAPYASGVASAADRFLAALTDELLELELGPVDAELRDRTRAWVVERFAGAGDLTRFGLAMTGNLMALAIALTEGRPFQRLPEPRRRAIAARLARTRLPLAGEYVKAIRSLAVAYVYEARFASAP